MERHTFNEQVARDAVAGPHEGRIQPLWLTAAPATPVTVVPRYVTIEQATALLEPKPRYLPPAGQTMDEYNTLVARSEWAALGNCRGIDTDLFFPGRGQSWQAPMAVCRGCEVQAECLAYALTLNEMFGVWGGKSEKERRIIRRQLRITTGRQRANAAQCGTSSGYRRHRSLMEIPCQPCREAHSAASMDRRARMKARRVDGAA